MAVVVCGWLCRRVTHMASRDAVVLLYSSCDCVRRRVTVPVLRLCLRLRLRPTCGWLPQCCA